MQNVAPEPCSVSEHRADGWAPQTGVSATRVRPGAPWDQGPVGGPPPPSALPSPPNPTPTQVSSSWRRPETRRGHGALLRTDPTPVDSQGAGHPHHTHLPGGPYPLTPNKTASDLKTLGQQSRLESLPGRSSALSRRHWRFGQDPRALPAPGPGENLPRPHGALRRQAGSLAASGLMRLRGPDAARVPTGTRRHLPPVINLLRLPRAAVDPECGSEGRTAGFWGVPESSSGPAPREGGGAWSPVGACRHTPQGGSRLEGGPFMEQKYLKARSQVGDGEAGAGPGSPQQTEGRPRVAPADRSLQSPGSPSQGQTLVLGGWGWGCTALKAHGSPYQAAPAA